MFWSLGFELVNGDGGGGYNLYRCVVSLIYIDTYHDTHSWILTLVHSKLTQIPLLQLLAVFETCII